MFVCLLVVCCFHCRRVFVSCVLCVYCVMLLCGVRVWLLVTQVCFLNHRLYAHTVVFACIVFGLCVLFVTLQCACVLCVFDLFVCLVYLLPMFDSLTPGVWYCGSPPVVGRNPAAFPAVCVFV